MSSLKRSRSISSRASPPSSWRARWAASCSALAEQPAVGQAGQFVVVQQVTQALLDVAAGTEIGEETDDVGRLAIAVAQQVELQPLGIGIAILPRIHQFALPLPVLAQLGADLPVVALGLGVFTSRLALRPTTSSRR